MNDYASFDFTTLDPLTRYRLLAGAVLPRPVAFVTTVDADGTRNAAPFSFFGVLSHDPATLAFGVEMRPDGQPKNTLANIRATRAFTVHIADVALVKAMEICARPAAAGVDKLHLAGLDCAEGTCVPSPRILAAPVAMECRLLQEVDLGPARGIVLGEVVSLFVRGSAVDDALRIDPAQIDAVGRMGGPTYATTRDCFPAPLHRA